MWGTTAVVPFFFGGWIITTKTKIIAIVAFLAVYGLGCLWLGHRNERLEWEAHVAKMEEEYVRKESEALRQAERLRQEQEKELIAQLEVVRMANAELVADAIRVREQFDALRSRRDSTGEQSLFALYAGIMNSIDTNECAWQVAVNAFELMVTSCLVVQVVSKRVIFFQKIVTIAFYGKGKSGEILSIFLEE